MDEASDITEVFGFWLLHAASSLPSLSTSSQTHHPHQTSTTPQFNFGWDVAFWQIVHNNPPFWGESRLKIFWLWFGQFWFSWFCTFSACFRRVLISMISFLGEPSQIYRLWSDSNLSYFQKQTLPRRSNSSDHHSRPTKPKICNIPSRSPLIWVCVGLNHCCSYRIIKIPHTYIINSVLQTFTHLFIIEIHHLNIIHSFHNV